jgi:drug/metabolite transporter (DMT)-like permease
MTATAAPRPTTRDQLIGMISLAFGLSIFGLQDAFIKLMSGGYAVHEIVFVRSVVALPIVLLVAARESRGFPRLRMLWMHAVRGLLMYLSYNLYYLAIARVSIAENASLYSVAPLFVTVLGALVLGERVGKRTWIALAVSGFGVLLILRPASGDFNPAFVFPLLSALAYALTTVCTRRLGRTEQPGALALSVTVIYVLGSAITGLALAGAAPAAEGSLFQFMLYPWRVPEPGDFGLMVVCGLISAIGFICISQGYRLAEANRAAPFEYSTMPSSVLWGYVFFQYVPSLQTITGAVIVVLGGLYALRLDRRAAA